MLISPDTHASRRRAPRRSGGLPIHVLVVDDHPAVRLGISRLISEQPDLAMIAEAASAGEAIGEMSRWADVAVVDYHLGGRDGLWLTRQLRRAPRAPQVLIYSAFADHALAVAAIVAGAGGLLSKSALHEELCVAIRRLARGRRHFPAIPPTLQRALRARLWRGDQALFDHLLHGLTGAQAAGALGITDPEVQARRDRILATIAPRARDQFTAARAPLDYDRPARKARYRAV